MLCPKCNQEIPESTTVCPNCGIGIVQSVPMQEKPSWQAYTTFYIGLFSIGFWCLCIIPVILGISELINISIKKSSRRGLWYVIFGLIFSSIGTYYFIQNPILGFYNAQVRSKISRVIGEQNLVATGLEAYYKDHSTYPLPDYDNLGNPIVPHSLTTPISYINALPIDPFTGNKRLGYHYFAGPAQDTVKTFWIITSLGSDKKMDLDITKYNPDDPYWVNLSTALGTYDPTNGTPSSGDIWRVGP